jgi:hypothetical protein
MRPRLRPPPTHYSVAFLHHKLLIDVLFPDVVHPAGGPPHDNRLDLRGCSKAKVKTRVAG